MSTAADADDNNNDGNHEEDEEDYTDEDEPSNKSGLDDMITFEQVDHNTSAALSDILNTSGASASSSSFTMESLLSKLDMSFTTKISKATDSYKQKQSQQLKIMANDRDDKRSYAEALGIFGTDVEKDILMKLLSEFMSTSSSSTASDDDMMIFFALCCLRSRLYSFNRALTLLRSYVKFRNEFAIQSTDSETVKRVRDVLLSGMIEYYEKDRCRNNRGIIIINPAKHNPALHSAKDIIIAFHYAIMYGLTVDPELQVRGFTIVVDLTNAALFGMDSKLAEQIFGALTSRLPMRYGNILVCNPPFMFSMLFGVVRLFLSSKMKDRVVKLDAKDQIFKFIDPSTLSPDLGGTNESRSAKWVDSLVDNIRSM